MTMGPASAGGRASLIADLLLAPVRSQDCCTDCPDAPLFPEEEEQVRGAVARRRREYATVRWCAREALRALGQPPAPLPRSAGGAPHWPVGVVGSMTHCDGYRAAAVARACDVRALGIDAEPDEPLPEEVLDLVLGGEDRMGVEGLVAQPVGGARAAGGGPEVSWDRLWFSAKEAVYKAWYPATGHWLDFGDVVVRAVQDRAGGGTFRATLEPEVVAAVGGRFPAHLDGCWVRRRRLLTAVHVPA